MRIAIILLIVFCASVLTAQDGPLTVGGNLRVRTDANGYLMVSEQSYTAPDGPLRNLANAHVRTDANGYLIITNPSSLGVIDATYITQTPNATLTAEQALDSLTSDFTINGTGFVYEFDTNFIGMGTADPDDEDGLAERYVEIDDDGDVRLVLDSGASGFQEVLFNRNDMNAWSFGSAGDFYIFNYGRSVTDLAIEDGTGDIGMGLTTPTTELQIQGSSTPSLYINSMTVSDGGSIFLEDTDGGGCSEVTVLNGVATWAIATCPS